MLSELRLGNFIAYKGELKWVVEIHQKGIQVWDKGKKNLLFVPTQQIAPIEIQETWLERLGFQKVETCWTHSNCLTISRNRDSWEVMVGLFLGNIVQFVPNAQNIVYIHQLQNIFHAISSLQELKIQ
jgi:hypothetical protein